MSTRTDRTRRELLRKALRLGGAGLLLGPLSYLEALAEDPALRRNLDRSPSFGSTPFTLGVASGDPAPDGFVIWTRLAPEPLAEHGGMAMRPVAVAWEVAEDERFAAVVRRGEAIAHPELAHSVHVEVDGLRPGRPYWYRFRAGGEASAPGRAATLPAVGARLDRLRFAVAGCQHYESGYYTAWRRIAAEELDFVFHYGDYIYEGSDGGGKEIVLAGRRHVPPRRHLGQELYSLDDYRRRYAQYKTDPDLQAAHAALPWFVSFDDHEVDNNWAGDHDQDGTPEEVFLLRRAAAMQAYYEHMPLRRAAFPAGGRMRMHRRAAFGDLVQAHFLDTRQYRSALADGRGQLHAQDERAFSPQRTILGQEQEAWLFEGLERGEQRWNLIAQQVMLMNLGRQRPGDAEPVYSMDQWSGYMHSRRRLLGHIEQRALTNVVTVSGDAHLHFAGDLIQDDGDGKVLSSEFLATSISSGGDGVGQDSDNIRLLIRDNPQLKAITDQRGYVVCDVGREVWHAELKVLDKVTTPGGTLSIYARFAVERGEPGLKPA